MPLDAEVEIWKDIEGYEGYYQVSNMANSRSLDRYVKAHTGITLVRARKLKTYIFPKCQYRYIWVSKYGIQKQFTLHRLVAIAFIENPLNHPQVNHKDGDKSNNSVSNLEWCTNDYNMAHAIRTGLIKVKGAENGNAKNISIQKDGIVRHFTTHREACNFIGVGDPALSNAIKRKNKCRGFEVIEL